MKGMIVLLYAAFAANVFAGLRIPGPIKLIDAEGEWWYEDIEIHDIIGDVDGVEIIGHKDGKSVSRGYSESATPQWEVVSTNIVSRPYQVLECGAYMVTSRCDVTISLSLSGTNQLLIVGSRHKPNCKEDLARGLDCKGRYWKFMTDSSSGLAYKGSQGDRFDDGSGESVVVSFYSNDTGAVKAWYEVVGLKNANLSKGWVTAVIDGERITGVSKSSVCGEDVVEVQLTSRMVQKQVSNPGDKRMSWLQVGFKKRDAFVSVGMMMKFKPGHEASP